MQRTLYATQVKFLVREGLLSAAILEQIPRSNIYRWRKEPVNKYKDFGLRFDASADYELLKSFAHNKTAKRIFTAYVRLISLALSIAHSLPQFRSAFKVNGKKIVEACNRIKDVIGLKRMVRLFNISVPNFRNWAIQSHTKCFESLTKVCNRVFPNQLSRPELIKLKELLQDPRFQYWPISSIAYHALRNQTLSISLNTWYKYVNKFGLNRPRPKSRRSKDTISIRAEKPNQIWHADITVIKTRDHVKHFIYLVVDNFSRKILSWKIIDTVKTIYRSETIQQALEAINSASKIVLITDGGSENKFSYPEM